MRARHLDHGHGDGIQRWVVAVCSVCRCSLARNSRACSVDSRPNASLSLDCPSPGWLAGGSEAGHATHLVRTVPTACTVHYTAPTVPYLFGMLCQELPLRSSADPYITAAIHRGLSSGDWTRH